MLENVCVSFFSTLFKNILTKFTISSATNLKIHVTMAHLRNQKPIAKKPKSYSKFKCDICPKMFKVERDMLDHRSAVHLNTLLYSCDFCGCRFSTNANKKVIMSPLKFQKNRILMLFYLGACLWQEGAAALPLCCVSGSISQ
jgi:hypothetical protein